MEKRRGEERSGESRLDEKGEERREGRGRRGKETGGREGCSVDDHPRSESSGQGPSLLSLVIGGGEGLVTGVWQSCGERLVMEGAPP